MKNKTYWAKFGKALAERDGMTCRYCGCPVIEPKAAKSIWDRFSNYSVRCKLMSVAKYATVDHVIPRSKGGTDGLENLVIACPHCNRKKGARL